MNNLRRDRRISKLILTGLSTTNAAKQFNLSSARCRQIVQSYCRRNNRDYYYSLREDGTGTVGFNTLRSHASDFIDESETDNKITKDSAIADINEFPTITINALRASNVWTVSDLLNVDLGEFHKFPFIGHLGLSIIKDFIIRHKHLTTA